MEIAIETTKNKLNLEENIQSSTIERCLYNRASSKHKVKKSCRHFNSKQ